MNIFLYENLKLENFIKWKISRSKARSLVVHSSNIGPWRVSTGPLQVMVALSSSANLIKNSSLYSTPLRLWQSTHQFWWGSWLKLRLWSQLRAVSLQTFANNQLSFVKIEHSIETLHQWLWECSAASALLDDNWASISSSLVWSWSSEKWGEVRVYQNQIKIIPTKATNELLGKIKFVGSENRSKMNALISFNFSRPSFLSTHLVGFCLVDSQSVM